MTKPDNPHSLHVAETFKIYYQNARKFPKDLALISFEPLSNVTLGVLMPFCASKVLAGLIVHSALVWTYFYLLIVSAIVGLIANQIGQKASMRLHAQTTDALNVMVFERLMQRSVGFYNNQIGGKLVSDALDFSMGFGELMVNTFAVGVNFATTTIVGLIVVFIGNWIIGISLTVLLVGLGIWTYVESIRRQEARHARLSASKAVIAHTADNIVNAITVKTFAQEASELKHAQKIGAHLKNLRIRDWVKTTNLETARMSILLLAQIVLIFVLIKLSAHNTNVLAAGIFAFTYTITLINRFFSINPLTRQTEEVFLKASPMTELLMQEPEVRDAPHATDLVVHEGAIHFKDVVFRYADAPAGMTVFHNLNLNIKPGEKIGLVGHSGGGKSTLTRLLLRFEDLTDGSIAIDGQNISDVKQTSLRAAIAYVPQEPLLFHRTIKENIAYGKRDASNEMIEHAAKMAYSHEFISELPEGYNTIVGERGVKLSGGQRQRIAIARAILKNAPILVLDEATSALDSESEALIQEALWNLMKDRTALVIAHRLSTIQHMDRIVVLEEGKIVEEGSHKDLLNHNGLYADLWKRQSGGFIKE